MHCRIHGSATSSTCIGHDKLFTRNLHERPESAQSASKPSFFERIEQPRLELRFVEFPSTLLNSLRLAHPLSAPDNLVIKRLRGRINGDDSDNVGVVV